MNIVPCVLILFMDFKRKVNTWRRAVLQRLTQNIGSSHINQPIDSSSVKRILISRPNHRLGNLLLMTPLVQEVMNTFPNCQVDLFVKGNLAFSVFKNYERIHQIIPLPKKAFKEFIRYVRVWWSIRKTPYDIVINVTKGSSSGRMSALFAQAKYKFFGDDIADLSRYNDAIHMAKQPVYYLRHCLAQLGLKENNHPVPLMDLKLNADELAAGKRKLKELVKNEQNTFCLFTYATGDKCYSPAWWQAFYEQLEKEFPQWNIIEVLPVENVSMISFRAPAYSHPDIRNVGALIANTNVFIGADSGVMHLASSVHVPTVGLFSQTDPGVYQPYHAYSFGIDTTTGHLDDYINIVRQAIQRLK
jgi:heptosyltransferase-3